MGQLRYKLKTVLHYHFFFKKSSLSINTIQSAENAPHNATGFSYINNALVLLLGDKRLSAQKDWNSTEKTALNIFTFGSNSANCRPYIRFFKSGL